MKSQPSSSAFFAAKPVFRRADFANALGRHPGERAVTDLLKYHLGAGNIRRLARGVFASVPKGTLVEASSVDRFLAASRLRIGAVIAYRSALELHGYDCGTKGANEVQLIARGEPGLLETADFSCRFVCPPRHHSPSDGMIIIERQGLAIGVTTLERTLVDLFDRYDLAGGAEGLFQSLDVVLEREHLLNIEALVNFTRRLCNAAAAGAMAYWLDHERHRLGVTDAALEELRSFAPGHARYALGATPGHGRSAGKWGVILPTCIIERYLDD